MSVPVANDTYIDIGLVDHIPRDADSIAVAGWQMVYHQGENALSQTCLKNLFAMVRQVESRTANHCCGCTFSHILWVPIIDRFVGVGYLFCDYRRGVGKLQRKSSRWRRVILAASFLGHGEGDN
jgi:hypothetical protein